MFAPVPTRRLFELAETLNVSLWQVTLPPSCGALSLFDSAWRRWIVLLDNRLQEGEPEFRCVLAEELGHVATVSALFGSRNLLVRANARRYEARAFRWAARTLLPARDLMRAVETGLSVSEIAEAFVVTPPFAHRALAQAATRAVAALGQR